jgi:hypothetical protein
LAKQFLDWGLEQSNHLSDQLIFAFEVLQDVELIVAHKHGFIDISDLQGRFSTFLAEVFDELGGNFVVLADKEH